MEGGGPNCIQDSGTQNLCFHTKVLQFICIFIILTFCVLCPCSVECKFNYLQSKLLICHYFSIKPCLHSSEKLDIKPLHRKIHHKPKYVCLQIRVQYCLVWAVLYVIFLVYIFLAGVYIPWFKETIHVIFQNSSFKQRYVRFSMLIFKSLIKQK